MKTMWAAFNRNRKPYKELVKIAHPPIIRRHMPCRPTSTLRQRRGAGQAVAVRAKMLQERAGRPAVELASDWLVPPIEGSENVVDALFNFGHGGFFARCQSAERKLRKEG
jgi:hypothetical protein